MLTRLGIIVVNAAGMSFLVIFVCIYFSFHFTFLSSSFLELTNNVSPCAKEISGIKCNYHRSFRLITAYCRLLQFPRFILHVIQTHRDHHPIT
jgi:hypothetical protein